MGLPTGRMEKRSARAVAVELSRPELSHAPETTFTENVSLHGVRVVSKQPWRIGDRLLVKSLEGDFRSQAQVMYCQRLPNNALAVGLELFTPVEEWGSPSKSHGSTGAKSWGQKAPGKSTGAKTRLEATLEVPSLNRPFPMDAGPIDSAKRYDITMPAGLPHS